MLKKVVAIIAAVLLIASVGVSAYSVVELQKANEKIATLEQLKAEVEKQGKLLNLQKEYIDELQHNMIDLQGNLENIVEQINLFGMLGFNLELIE